MTPRPQSLVGLIGPPRSGTTLIANAILSHSRVTGIIEPYQVRREAGYGETDLARLMANFGLSPDAAPHVAIKETTTREANVAALLKLLENTRQAGLYTGLVIILRCPYSAYLSQIEASREMWREKKLNEVTEQNFRGFARSLQERLYMICARARAQHFRIVSYEAFCRDPDSEAARLMALFPERLEPGQLQFAPPKGIAKGGDPKTQLKSGSIKVDSREEQCEELRQRFADLSATRFMDKLRLLTLQKACVEPDGTVLDALARLTILHQRS